MLWGFLNTLQIISYFPFLSVYFPKQVSSFIESLAIANFKIEIGFVEETIDNIKDSLIGNNDYDLYPDNETYEQNGIDSLSILRNASGMMTIFFQGLCTCLLVFALKAKFVTVPNLDNQENDLKTKFKAKKSSSISFDNLKDDLNESRGSHRR